MCCAIKEHQLGEHRKDQGCRRPAAEAFQEGSARNGRLDRRSRSRPLLPMWAGGGRRDARNCRESRVPATFPSRGHDTRGRRGVSRHQMTSRADESVSSDADDDSLPWWEPSRLPGARIAQTTIFERAPSPSHLILSPDWARGSIAGQSFRGRRRHLWAIRERAGRPRPDCLQALRRY